MIGTPEKLSQYLWTLDKDKKYEIKEYKEKRSLNANNYMWQLITKIADVLRVKKEDVYLDLLKGYGQSDLISVLEDVPVQDYLKYYERAGESTLNGKKFIHYKVYKGSSEMNTKEMSILIDGVVQEAKALEIETLTPNELQSLKESWKE